MDPITPVKREPTSRVRAAETGKPPAVVRADGPTAPRPNKAAEKATKFLAGAKSEIRGRWSGIYVTRRRIPLRKEPHFASATIQEMKERLRINVLEAGDSRLKVKITESGKIGFVRREFVAPVESARK